MSLYIVCNMGNISHLNEFTFPLRRWILLLHKILSLPNQGIAWLGISPNNSGMSFSIVMKRNPFLYQTNYTSQQSAECMFPRMFPFFSFLFTITSECIIYYILVCSGSYNCTSDCRSLMPMWSHTSNSSCLFSDPPAPTPRSFQTALTCPSVTS